VRLRGIHFVDNANPAIDYRIDLPATGAHNARLAMGDASNAQTTSFADVDANVETGHFLDASGTEHLTEAAWVSSNTPVARTFTTTIFRTRIGASVSTGGGSSSCIATVYIEEAAGGWGGLLSGQRNRLVMS
jgi:hypothetical protein